MEDDSPHTSPSGRSFSRASFFTISLWSRLAACVTLASLTARLLRLVRTDGERFFRVCCRAQLKNSVACPSRTTCFINFCCMHKDFVPLRTNLRGLPDRKTSNSSATPSSLMCVRLGFSLSAAWSTLKCSRNSVGLKTRNSVSKEDSSDVSSETKSFGKAEATNFMFFSLLRACATVFFCLLDVMELTSSTAWCHSIPG